MTLDVNTFIGAYPFRHVPHPEPEALVRVLEREGVSGAWVGHLPSAFHSDHGLGNAELVERLSPFAPVLVPVPAIRPDWPGWRAHLAAAAGRGAPAIRTYPQCYGLAPGDARLTELAAASAHSGCAIVLTVKFEDARQRHVIDAVPDLSAAHVRELARAGTGATIVVTAPDRQLVEEVFWGLTPDERALVFFDISWLWGPPVDDFSHLLRTVGGQRFLFGTMWPLRLAQLARANLSLVEDDQAPVTLADPTTWQSAT